MPRVFLSFANGWRRDEQIRVEYQIAESLCIHSHLPSLWQITLLITADELPIDEKGVRRAIHEYSKAICRVWPAMNRPNAEDDPRIPNVVFMGKSAVLPYM